MTIEVQRPTLDLGFTHVLVSVDPHTGWTSLAVRHDPEDTIEMSSSSALFLLDDLKQAEPGLLNAAHGEALQIDRDRDRYEERS